MKKQLTRCSSSAEILHLSGINMAKGKFALLANQVKEYLTDCLGMNKLEAGLMAVDIVEAQRRTFEKIMSIK